MAFEDNARRTLEALIAYDERAQRRDGVVLKQPPSAQLQQDMNLAAFVREGGLSGERLSRFVDTYLDGTITLRDPRNMGHQTAIPNAGGSLGGMIDAYATNPMAINEMGPAAAAIEQFYIDWMLDKVGWPVDPSRIDRAGGVLTHGGSLANLTALCAARAAMAPEAWQTGNPQDVVILAPPSAHYSISRAVGIMGFGQTALIAIPVDGQGRSDPDALAQQIDAVQAGGKTVMAVAASACQTASGLYDPLRAMGEICRERQVWFHVDGAHGAGALLSPKLRHLMDGVELADSLIWDAHKMLQTPCICAAVLMRDQRRIDNAFVQDASYIFHERDNPGFDFAGRAVECTKAALGLKAFMALAETGESGMARHIESLTELAASAAEWIDRQPDFEIAVTPQSNIVCFRRTGEGETCSLELRRRLLKGGRYYVTSTEYLGHRWLRLTLMNPRTTLDDVRGLLDELRSFAGSEAVCVS